MIKQIKTLGMITLAFFLFACAGGKDVLFEPDPPFQIKKTTAQDWVSGVQGGGSGTIVTVYLGTIHEDIQVKDIYFGEGIAKAERDPRNIDKFVARFTKSKNHDLIMDENPRKEAENTPPIKSPFSLEKNEMVISYLHEGELQFYKFNEVEEKPILAYPGVKSNGLDH